MPTPPPSPPPLVSPSPAPSTSTLVATPATVALHPGGTATIALSGATGAVSVTLAQGLAIAMVDATTERITFAASTRTGSDIAHIADSTGASVDVPVRVALDAGTIPPSLTLQVTGSPIDPAWFLAQITAAVTRGLTLVNGATAEVSPVPPASPPPPGASSTIAVPVQISGDGTTYDVSGSTTLTVQNVAVEPFAPPVLLYDDDPERITADGLVFRGTVVPQTPARLYYYHDDGVDSRRLAIILSAASPTSVQVIDSSAGPNVDVMSVGHTASKNYIEMALQNEGTILDLAAGTPYVLHDVALDPKEGVAGSVAMHVLDGSAVTVSIVAYSPGVDPLSLLAGPLAAPDGHHRAGDFSIVNFGTDSLAYAVGGPDTKIVYADRDSSPPPIDSDKDGRDYGDYGVLHTFLFSLSNPTGAPATVYLYERPIGGIVRSSFLVDGSVTDVGCVRLSVPYQISAFDLAAGGRYQVTVQTMTDGGSNYPLEIGMTSTPPQPAAPPISSPDGCFPKPVAPG